MGIDRIGKNAPAAPPPPEESATQSTDPTRRPFEVPAAVNPSRAAQSAEGVPAAGSPLERWRSGQIDLEGYLDAKVDEATRHLGVLPAGQLDAIRQALRERIAGDPTLVELVRTATGRAPDAEGEK